MKRLAGLLAIVCLIVVAAFSLEVIQDETYYWTWSRDLRLSYVDHPPMVAWILAASTRVFGSGLAGLQIPTLLSMLIVIAASVLGARRLAGDQSERATFHATLALLGAPMFVIGYLPATPDPFQGAAAAVAAYAIIRAFERDASSGWSFAAGLLLVGSGLTKHSSALLAIGAVAGALMTRDGRNLLRRPAPWLGALVGLLALLPWLWTDLNTSQGSLAFQIDRVFSRGVSRGLMAVPMWLGGIMVALGPSTALLMFAFAKKDEAHAVETSLWTGGTLLLVACLLPVWSGGGELNWSMPALVFVGPALAARVARIGGRWERVQRGVGLLSAAVSMLLLCHVIHPFLPLPALRDTTRRGAGFDRLAAEVEALAEKEGARVLITRRYQTASMLRYHLRDRWPVLELGTTRPSQYDVTPRPQLCPGDRAIVVLNEELPSELQVERSPATRFDRTIADEVVEHWTLTPVLAAPISEADLHATAAICERIPRAMGGS